MFILPSQWKREMSLYECVSNMIIGSGGGGRKSSIGGGPKSKSGNASSSGRQRSLGGAGPRPVEVKETDTLVLHQIAPSSQARLLSYHSLLLIHCIHDTIPQTFFPMVVDGSAQTILAMQRQMESMASELRMLRTKVMQSEVKHDLDIQRYQTVTETLSYPTAVYHESHS